MRYILLISFLLPLVSLAYIPVDEIKVYKSAHKMDLLFQGKITKSYKVMLGRGGLEPKIQEGDNKTPEGKYFLDEKNPKSDYFRSIHITYPNEDDLRRAKEMGVEPGGEIFIHGLPNSKSKFVRWIREKAVKIKDKTNNKKILKTLDWTKGCIAVSDSEIEEVFNTISLPMPITIYH